MALSAAANTPQRAHPFKMTDSRPMAGSTTVYAGGLVCKNASGYVVPGATSTTLVALGCADKTVVNAGANGAVNAQFTQGVFRLANSSAGDLIAIADIGADCYIVDDSQVAKTSATNTRSRAGKIMDVDANGVWVLVGIGV